MHQRREQVRLLLPRTGKQIQQAVTAFQQQFQTDCFLYVKGSLIIATGETCLAPSWIPVCRPDLELDVLGLGDPSVSDDDEALTWVAQTNHACLLLCSFPLDTHEDEADNHRKYIA